MATILSDLVSHLQCGEAIAANDAVYINSADGKIYKYSPLDPTQVFAGIAKEAGLLNAFIRVVQSGRVKGFTGLTPGAFVYASVTVPGGFQLTEPGSTLKVVLGIAKSATELTVNGALGIKTGGDGTGSGSLDTILQLTATEQFTDWSTGNNATVLAGGVLAGSFVKETSTPLHGAESYKYTQAAGSLNDYFLSKSFPVDVRFRGQQVYFSAPIQYNGNTGDIQIVIYDVTNATVLTTLSNSIIGTNGATQTVIASALLPLTCVNVRVGFQVKVLNSGKVFSFDDVQLSQSLYQAAQLNNVTDWVPATFSTLAWQGLGTVTNTGITTRRNGSNLEIRGRFDVGTVTASTIQIPFPNNFGTVVNAASQAFESYGNILRAQALANTNFPTRAATVGVSYFEVAGAMSSSTASPNISVGGTGAFSNNDTLTFQLLTIPIKGWSAGNTAIVTPTQQISSDTLPFTFKSTAIVDADPIGTFNTYTYAASSGSPVISASAPTQTVADMNVSGFRIFARAAFTSATTSASPARVQIKLGAGLSSTQLNGFVNANKSVGATLDNYLYSTNVIRGLAYKDYDKVTGILTLDAGMDLGPSTYSWLFNTAAAGTASSVYVTFAASTSPSITALPILQPRIAYLSDVKANNTGGGTTNGTVYAIRTLNTLVDTYGVVTSLTANQFILQAGTYKFEGFATAYGVDRHRARIRNVTDSTTAILGSSGNSAAASTNSNTTSNILGELTIASTKTFELQHYTQTTLATNGFGLATNSGESEVYSVIAITKIR